ncbi:MAG: hypothetical protein QXD66_04205 [Candidatus Nezhaarchaeales archaeon]|nr:MAG: hypothetical protein DSO05_06080 [Candidatus Nezhaarchaeota archaeon WYZ-LMO7]TDA34980.1 MAG: hypothetical protein DSO06_03810 [Candidatus Nezhaarchaeota archaeon WYZ-LMO8]
MLEEVYGAELHRIGALYNKVTNVKPKLLLITVTIDKGALEYLGSLK